MTRAETRALSRAAAVLILISTVRIAVESRRGVPLFESDSASVLPALSEAVGEARTDRERRAKPLGPSERLDPNTASEVDLDRLPGVGAATALAIVRERASSGGFRSPDELLRVRGIGPTTLERIRPHLEVSVIPRRFARRTFENGARATEATRRVDLNRADSASLLVLPGIGPSLAGRILAYRKQQGPFRRVEELVNVRGIGPATMAKLDGYVTVRR
ncbi:MAG: ComEA family DNA-binding protein [Longimicrobiales bacterium]